MPHPHYITRTLCAISVTSVNVVVETLPQIRRTHSSYTERHRRSVLVASGADRLTDVEGQC